MLARFLTTILLLSYTFAGSTPCANAGKTATSPACQTAYASTLTMLNSRYPSLPVAPSRFFMLSRHSTFQIAMQVQFTAFPGTAHTCRLNLILPSPEMSIIHGPRPIFNVYAVEREAGAPATWETYEGVNKSAAILGTVNGEKMGLDEVMRANRTLTVGEVKCNETLTFHMGLGFDGEREVNYWEFVDVSPGATPVQGWRVVHSC